MTAYKTAARTAAVPLAALVFAFVFTLAAAAEPAAATLGNADIVAMTRASVAPALIINRIQSSPNSFDLSDMAFMELKANGVADEVLSAMLAASRSGGAASAANSLGMQLPALPAIGGNDWSDFGADLANLPPPPALPAFSAPAGAGTQAGLPALPALPSMTSMPSLDMPPAVPALSSAVPSLPAFSAVPAAPAAMNAVPAPAAPAFDALRFDRELVTIINGAPDAQRAGLAWMLANQQQTMPGLRQALAAASRPEMQAGAVQVLGEMNDQPSLPVIRDLLGSPSPLVRKEAARALARMNDAVAIGAAEQNLGNPVDPLDGLIHLVGYARLVRASDRLGTILSGNPSAVNRAAAAAALAEIGRGAAAAWPALEGALANDADANVRREAARAVAQFHDPSSAALLMAACRRDPEVRKVTLEAMADYPESVEFLVGVAGLGADQIAPDEAETARASLAKLTGRNFGADGAQWASWFAENKSRFAAAGSALAAAPAASGLAAPFSGAALPPPVSVPPVAARGGGIPAAPGQVDITALGMIVDPSQIPMAPELEQQASAPPAGGVLRIPGAGLGTGGAPGALSANDFGGGVGGPAGGADSLGLLGDAGAAGGAGRGRLPTPAGFEEYGDEQMWGGSMPAGGASSGTGMDLGMGGFGGGASSATLPAGASAPALPPSSMSSLPQQPVVSPAPSAPAGAGAGSGLRLALPPMTGGGFGGDGGFGGTATVPAPDYAAQPDFSSPAGFPAQTDFPAQSDFSPPADYAAQSDFGMPPADYPAPAEYADTQPYDPMAVPADAVPYDESEWQQYMDPMDPSAGSTAEGDPFADPYAGGDASMLFGEGDAPADPYEGMALPPPPGMGGSPDAIAFPGDTDAFGIGDPMFGDDGTGGFVGDEYASDLDGGAQLAMPPLPGGDAAGGGYEEALEPRGPDILENYGYGEFDDGLSDSDADFAVDDFEAFLREADEAATAHADTLPDGTETPAERHEGTAEWASGVDLPPIGEPYTMESGTGTPAQGGAPVMELVRGVGLVEREAPAAPASAPEYDEALPEPELIVPAPLSAPETDSAEDPPAPAGSGGWYYVEPYGSASGEDAVPADDDTPDVPIIAEDVYEVPAEEDALPADPSGRPSRTLRMRR